MIPIIAVGFGARLLSVPHVVTISALRGSLGGRYKLKINRVQLFDELLLKCNKSKSIRRRRRTLDATPKCNVPIKTGGELRRKSMRSEKLYSLRVVWMAINSVLFAVFVS